MFFRVHGFHRTLNWMGMSYNWDNAERRNVIADMVQGKACFCGWYQYARRSVHGTIICLSVFICWKQLNRGIHYISLSVINWANNCNSTLSTVINGFTIPLLSNLISCRWQSDILHSALFRRSSRVSEVNSSFVQDSAVCRRIAVVCSEGIRTYRTRVLFCRKRILLCGLHVEGCGLLDLCKMTISLLLIGYQCLYLKSGLFVTENALAAARFECFCVQLTFPAPFVFRESVLASTFRQ